MAHQKDGHVRDAAEPSDPYGILYAVALVLEQLELLVGFRYTLLGLFQARWVYPVDPDSASIYPLVPRGRGDEDLLYPDDVAERHGNQYP